MTLAKMVGCTCVDGEANSDDGKYDRRHIGAQVEPPGAMEVWHHADADVHNLYSQQLHSSC